jgi:phosphotransferase system IIA component
MMLRHDKVGSVRFDDLTLGRPIDGDVRRIDETGHAFGMPMVTPGLPLVAIHALLNHVHLPSSVTKNPWR